MQYAFYIAAAVALFATFRVITNTNPVHALLNLIISLLAVAVIFFSLGAPFAGILEVIVYAGAIMVLFVFVVMMLNLGDVVIAQEKEWLKPKLWLGPSLLALILLGLMGYALVDTDSAALAGHTNVGAKEVGTALFGKYVIVVELAAMLLLAALVAAFHLGRQDDSAE